MRIWGRDMNPADIVYTRKAEDDLNSVFDYIGADSPSNALNYICKIRRAIELVNCVLFLQIQYIKLIYPSLIA